MPFSKPEDQQQFDMLIELIKQNKPTEVEFYKEQWTADWQRIPAPAEWCDWGWDKPVMPVSRTIHQDNNVSGPHWFYYKWKNPNGLRSILTPAFDENRPVGLRIQIPTETSPEDLARLFAAIEQNDAFAAQVVEMDFSYCKKLTQRVEFPKNLTNMLNLFMDRISTTFICGGDGPYDPYDLYDGSKMYATAQMGAPDLSSMHKLKKLSFENTRLTEWPILPKSLEEYVQYGSSPMSLMRFNLSSRALPNLKRVYFEGGCTVNLSVAYAICVSRMLQWRPEVKMNFAASMYQLTNGRFVYGADLSTLELTSDLLDAHFEQIVNDSSYGNRVLVTEAELRNCASILNDMLVDARDVTSQAVVAAYVKDLLPAVIAKVEAIRIARANRASSIAGAVTAAVDDDMEQDGFVHVPRPRI